MTITPPTEPFSVSRMAVLECRSSGSRPPATITWWKRAKFMGKATEEVSNRKTVGLEFVRKLKFVHFKKTVVQSSFLSKARLAIANF